MGLDGNVETAIRQAQHRDETRAAGLHGAAYRGAVALALARPWSNEEQAVSGRIADAMRRSLGLEAPEAARQARRCLLLRRVQQLHEVLALQASPAVVRQMLDGVEVRGLDHLAGLDPRRGVVLVSLHYSLYSSLLPLWLAGATARGWFHHLTLLLDSGPTGSLKLSPERTRELEAAGLGRSSQIALVDRRREGPALAARRLLGTLRQGGAVLLLPDAPAGEWRERRTLGVSFGGGMLRLPAGVGWLARSTQCSLVPVCLQPHGEGYRVVFGPPATFDAAQGAGGLDRLFSELLARTVLRDPAPWESWLWLHRLERAPPPAGPGE